MAAIINNKTATCLLSFLFLKFLLLYALQETCSIDDKDHCDTEISEAHEKNKYFKDSKWREYLYLIEDDLKNYKPCLQENCSCHQSVIEGDLSIWKDQKISQSSFNMAKERGTHYQIIDHKLYRESECMFPFRCSGVEYFILKIIEDLSDTEFILNTRDWPQVNKNYQIRMPVLSFSKTKEFWDITYPAWTFWEGGPAISLYPTGIGRWDQQREIISEYIKQWPWESKKSIAFFRGSRTSAERDPLILFSRQNPSIVDAQYTKNQAWRSMEDTLGADPAVEVRLEEHCQYKYLFNFRGVAASFRFKHLFLCKSLVFHVGNEWNEFFYPAMKPWVHYIPVRQDLSDIRELLEFARENDEIAEEIALRGWEFIWNHLRMEDVECYWKKLLLKYTSLLDFEIKKNSLLSEIRLKQR